MITLSSVVDDAGVATLSAGSRAAMTAHGGDGESVGLVARLLGLDARRRLAPGSDSTVVLTVDVKGTELVLTLLDQGEPVTSAPSAVMAMLESGLGTAAEARTDGHGNVTEVRFALPSHHLLLDATTVEIVPDDTPLSDQSVTLRPLAPEDAPALTRVLYRCYGWTYPVASMYYPERIAAALESGQRIGEVAVTAEGEIAAHWGAVFLSPNVVETGGTVTDPRFRKRGLAGQLGDRLLDRLREMGVGGRVREPVMTHPATQRIALSEGATMVGAYIHITHSIDQIGITDGVTADRGSLSVAYSALAPLTPAVLWIPLPYEGIARQVLAAADWPREIGGARKDPDTPERTILSTTLDTDNRRAGIDVDVVGRDLIDEVSAALTQMRRAGMEHVTLTLPANQPALATVGAGLMELGFAYGAVIPAFRGSPGDAAGGDVLVTQWVDDTRVDTTEWVFADDSVRDLVLAVVAQVEEAGNRGQVRQRRAARRAELLAALGE